MKPCFYLDTESSPSQLRLAALKSEARNQGPGRPGSALLSTGSNNWKAAELAETQQAQVWLDSGKVAICKEEWAKTSAEQCGKLITSYRK